MKECLKNTANNSKNLRKYVLSAITKSPLGVERTLRLLSLKKNSIIA